MSKWATRAVWTLTAVAAVVAGIEIAFRKSGGASQEAAGHLVAVALAGSCQEVPGARQHFIKEALSYSLRNPIELPPWWLLQTVLKSSGREPDAMAAGMCAFKLEALHQTKPLAP